mgnify:CR=1 FL=1|jgi:fibronectin-binding autotransporter adhesin
MTTVIPSATDATRRGNLKLKSLSLKDSNNLSLAVDMTVTDERLVIATNDGTTTNVMFSVLGTTLEMPTLSVSNTLAGDLSASGVTTLNILSVHAVSSGLSVGGASLLVGPVVTEDSISVANALTTQGGVSVGGTLDVGSTLLASGNVLLQSQLSVTGETILSNTLEVKGPSSTFHGAVRAGSLSVQGDVYVDNVLFVNVSAVSVAALLHIDNSVVTTSTLSVAGAARLSNILHVTGDRIVADGDLSVQGGVAFGGMLSVGGSEGVVSERLSVGTFATLAALSSGASTLLSAKVQGDLSIAGNLIVEGTTTTINTATIDIEDPIIEIGGGEALCGVKIIKDSDSAAAQSGMFREGVADDGTPAFFAFYESFNVSDADPSNHVKTVGDLRIAGLSTSGALHVSSYATFLAEVSVNGHMNVKQSLSVDGPDGVSIVGPTKIDAGLSVGQSFTLGNALSVGGDVDVVGKAQILSVLSAGSHVVIAESLSVGGVDGAFIVGPTDLSSSLSVGDVVVAASSLSVGASATLADSLSVADTLVITPGTGSNVFTLSAPTLTLNDTSIVGGLYTMLFDERPTSVTFRETGKTDIVSAYGSVFANAPDPYYNSTSGKWVLEMQYFTGTTTPVQTPADIVVVMPKGYSTKYDFVIRREADKQLVHDLRTFFNPVDIFTSGSGQVVPMLSLAGDAAISAALSIGHALVVDGTGAFSDHVGMGSTLSVGGISDLTGAVRIGVPDGITAGADMSLSVSCPIVAQSMVSIGGDTTMTGDLSLGGSLHLAMGLSQEGDMAIGGSLSVSDDGHFASGVFISGLSGLSVSGMVNTDSRVTAPELSCGSSFLDGVEVGSVGVVVQGPTRFAGDFSFDVEGSTTVNIESDLSVGSNSVLNNLSAGGSSSLVGIAEFGDSISVAQSGTVGGSLSIGGVGDFASAVTLHDALSVASGVVMAGGVSVGGSVEVTQNALVRGLQTVNGRLSVGGAGTVKSVLSVGDTITGGRDLSVGHLVLDRTRTTNRYYLTTPLSNTGLEVEVDAENMGVTFSSGEAHSSVNESGQFFVRSQTGVQIEWFEVASDKTNANIVAIKDRNDDSALSLNLSLTVSAGVTALSVGHDMILGIDGTDTYLSVGSRTDIAGRTQLGSTLSVGGDATLASAVSVGGTVDIVGAAQLGSTLSAGGDATLASAVSVGGAVDIVGAVQLGSTLSVGDGATLTGAVSVGGAVDIVGAAQILSTVSAGGDATLASAVSVGGAVDVVGSAQFGSTLSAGDAFVASSSLSVGAIAVLASSFSVGGDATLASAVSVASTVDVVGVVQLGSTLSVASVATLANDLSVGGRVDVAGSVNVDSLSVDGWMGMAVTGGPANFSREVSVSGHVVMAQSLSIGGPDGVAIVGPTEIEAALSVGQSFTLAHALSAGGAVDIVGVVQMGSTLSVGGDATLASAVSVGGAVDVVGAAQLGSTLSAGGDATLASAVSVGGAVDVAGVVQLGSTLSAGGNATLSSALSVANMIMTPEIGTENEFVLTDPITSTTDAVHFYVDLRYPHVCVLKTAGGNISFTQDSQTHTATDGSSVFRSTFSSATGISVPGGQVNGFSVTSTSPHLTYMTPLEVVGVSIESSAATTTVIHTPASGTSALTGGKKVPSLSVGGEVVVLESLSVGFGVTVSEHLSVHTNVVSNLISCASGVVGALSTNTLFVQTSDLGDLLCQTLSAQNAFFEHVEISGQDALSVAGKVELTLPDVQFLSTGMNMGADKQLSIGGETFMTFLSVSTAHVDTLSVASAIAAEISVHTLFVQQVTTNDPDQSFGFQDDAVFQGDLTIDGKLFVKDILYTGPGGQFSIENVGYLNIPGVLSVNSMVFEMHTPASSTDTGSLGQMTVDTQYLYVCVAANDWRRVAFSAF